MTLQDYQDSPSELAQALGFHSPGAVKKVMTLKDIHECLMYPFDKRADATASLLLSHSRECPGALKPLAFRLCPGSREIGSSGRSRRLGEIEMEKILMNFRGAYKEFPSFSVSDPLTFMPSMNFMKRVKFLSIKNEGGTP